MILLCLKQDIDARWHIPHEMVLHQKNFISNQPYAQRTIEPTLIRQLVSILESRLGVYTILCLFSSWWPMRPVSSPAGNCVLGFDGMFKLAVGTAGQKRATPIGMLEFDTSSRKAEISRSKIGWRA
jgi:hypothetical protein